MEFPKFTYHPDPLATGNIQPSEEPCPCCGRVTGYAYAKPPYGTEDVENLCPWCIADGSAAEKFDLMFTDAHPLAKAGLDASIINEVVRRTPGYVSWQQEEWLSCCHDACEFHGDLSKDELRKLDPDTAERFIKAHRLSVKDFTDLQKHYQPKGDPALYKFVCRHCGKIHLGMDFS